MAKSLVKRTRDAALTTAADCARKAVTDRAANVTEHDIARRTYDRYLGRDCEDGHDVEDWFQAERELRPSSAGDVVDRPALPPGGQPAPTARMLTILRRHTRRCFVASTLGGEAADVPSQKSVRPLNTGRGVGRPRA
jgi:hypothetical protein